jgi:hypothetical protein
MKEFRNKLETIILGIFLIILAIFVGFPIMVGSTPSDAYGTLFVVLMGPIGGWLIWASLFIPNRIPAFKLADLIVLIPLSILIEIYVLKLHWILF